MFIEKNRVRSATLRLLVVTLAALALTLGFAGALFAQTTTGTITGTVTDAQGAAIANANVLIHNTDTGIDTPTKTNDTGIYTVPLLQPGNYDITSSLTGFATVQNKGIRVQVGETERIDIQMPVASQQSLVTVTTEVPLVETEKTEASQTVSENLVADLPVSSRRWEQFVMLTPGVVADGPVAGMSFHGVNATYNSNSVDGANNLNSTSAAARGTPANDGYVYSGDSIREFQVASNNYNAELGNAGGAVNAVTKSGTSQLHGDLFYNMRNPIFNAIDPVSKAATPAGQTPTQSVHQQNQFGGSVGGPIVKDKLFYFVTYDGYRKSTPIDYTSSTNIASLACPSTTYISVTQCASAKSYILNDNLGFFPRVLRQDVALAKLDYQANASNHFNAVFNWRNWNEPDSVAYATAANSGLTTAANSFIQNRFVIATWNKVFGNDKVNQLLYQFGQDNSYSVLRGSQGGPASLTAGASASQVPPNVVLSNIFGYGSNSSDPGLTYEDRHQINDSFSWGSGRHAFKAGVDLNFLHTRLRSQMTFGGLYSYSSAVALNPGPGFAATGCPASGNGTIFCDWLFDLYGVSIGDGKNGQHWNSYAQIKDQRYPGNTIASPLPAGQTILADDFTDQEYGSYIQDTWKIRPNVTLNLGLRYDVQVLPGTIQPNTNTPLLALYTSTENVDHFNFGPRVGVAWNLAKNTVIRAGGGLFYGLEPLSAIYISRTSNGLFWQQFNCSPGSFAIPCGSGVAGTALTFPNVLYAQETVAPGPSAPFAIPGSPANQQPLTPVIVNPAGDACKGNSACGTRALDPHVHNPRVLEAQVAFERQLPGGLGFTATYVMTRSTQLPAFWDTNLAPATFTKSYDVVDTTGATQLTSTVPFFTQRVNATTGSILTEFSAVTSWYNAMILTVRRPSSHGFEFLANYTLSHSTDDGEASYSNGTNGPAQEVYFNGPSLVNPYNLKGEQATSGLDTPNRFAGSVVWTPPYAKNLTNRYERGVADGWSLSTTITASNGSRYTGFVQSSSTQCSLGIIPVGQTCASAGGGMGFDGGMAGSDITGIGNLFGGRIAWQPRNSYELPNYADVDVRLEKQFTLRERYNFDFRAEAFNLFNSSIIQAVNQNAYTYATPSGSTGSCPATGANAHTNTCMIPVSTFQSPTTTTGILLGARQMQFGFRFEF